MSDALQSEEMVSPAAARIAALPRVSGAQVVDEGIQLARQNYGALVMAALVPLLPYFGMDIWTASRREGLGTWTMLIFTAVWASLADAAAARVAMDALEGRSPDPGRGLRIALRRAWPVVASGLYRAIVGFVGLALVLVPGFYLLSVYALIPILPVLESPLGAWRALRRSAALTHGARRLTFGTYVVPYAFVFGANVLMSELTQSILGFRRGHMLGGLVGSCVALAMTPFIACIQVRLYVELRMRKEAIDIEWALAAPSETTST